MIAFVFFPCCSLSPLYFLIGSFMILSIVHTLTSHLTPTAFPSFVTGPKGCAEFASNSLTFLVTHAPNHLSSSFTLEKPVVTITALLHSKVNPLLASLVMLCQLNTSFNLYSGIWISCTQEEYFLVLLAYCWSFYFDIGV